MITNAPSVKARILVGATGSLDATLLPTYLREIKNSIDCSLTAMFTPNATKFVNMDSIALFVDRLICGDDPKDWATDKPGRIAAEHDILAIMPATANTLSAVANGSSLNRLTTVVLAAKFPLSKAVQRITPAVLALSYPPELFSSLPSFALSMCERRVEIKGNIYEMMGFRHMPQSELA
ncbi:Flavoprotein [Pseudovibrio sp. Tun.PSC04-5.I4]|nr:Flavoprotein [Pseudovibrio sp. Tun.PSC04-5.I4]